MFPYLGPIVVLLGGPAAGAAGPPAAAPTTVGEVYGLLGYRPRKLGEPHPLLVMGPRAFPALERIITDPETKPLAAANALAVAGAIPGGRGRFLDLAVACLAHEDGGVRWSAVEFVGRHGGEADLVPVVPLLDDDDLVVRVSAAKALEDAGGRRALVAMDGWLRTADRNSYPPDDIARVRKHRAALAARLARQAPPPREAKR
ncbi:MAG: HEAT repeat domain-containing protein [Gemmataceae bacterium]|nr:HEAT repeat domain-containing protein [Gemmataceae bacterium]